MILIAGVVVSMGVAAGLDLFLTLALSGLLSVVASNPAFQDVAALGSPVLLVPSLSMVLVESLLERHVGLDMLWRQLNTFIRPVGAAGLTALMLSGLPPRSLAGAVLTAAAIAVVVHGGRSGWAFLVRIRDTAEALRRGLRTERGIVLVLVLCNWWDPWPALVLSAVVLGWMVIRSRVLLPAFGLTLHLTVGRVRGFVRHGRWVAPPQFPTWIKTRLSPAGVVTGGRLRATPAACVGATPRPFVRFGWLVVRGARPIFASRHGRVVDTLPLTLPHADAVSTGPMCLLARPATPENGTVILVLPEDGPGPDQIRAELA